jgi:hypothetical protein
MANGETKEIDRGYKRIIRFTKKIKNSFVKIGLQGNTGNKIHEDSKLTIVNIGVIHEFGTTIKRKIKGKKNIIVIPERSFIRSTFDEKNRNWSVKTKVLLDKIMIGKVSVSKALDVLGLLIQKDIKKKINSNIPPPNAPSTAMKKRKKGKKGKIKTLIDTGTMLRSIIFETFFK